MRVLPTSVWSRHYRNFKFLLTYPSFVSINHRFPWLSLCVYPMNTPDFMPVSVLVCLSIEKNPYIDTKILKSSAGYQDYKHHSFLRKATHVRGRAIDTRDTSYDFDWNLDHCIEFLRMSLHLLPTAVKVTGSVCGVQDSASSWEAPSVDLTW